MVDLGHRFRKTRPVDVIDASVVSEKSRDLRHSTQFAICGFTRRRWHSVRQPDWVVGRQPVRRRPRPARGIVEDADAPELNVGDLSIEGLYNRAVKYRQIKGDAAASTQLVYQS